MLKRYTGIALGKIKQWKLAARLIQSYLDKNPDAPASDYYRAGVYWMKAKEYANAEPVLEISVQKAPGVEKNNLLYIDALKQNKKLNKAIEVCRNYIELCPQSDKTWYKLSTLLRKQGKWWQEIEALKAGLALQPNRPKRQYQLAEALEVMNRFQEAAQAYQAAIELQKAKQDNTAPAEWYYRQGYCYEREGHDGPANPQAAQMAYQQAIEKDTEHDAKRFGIGDFHQARGHWVQAAQAYHEQLQTNTNDPELYFKTGMAHDRCYEWPKAALCYEKAIDLVTPDGEHTLNPYWYYRLGFVYERMGEGWQQKAIDAYQQATEHSEKYQRYWHYRKAYVLMESGRLKEAAEAFLLCEETQELSRIDSLTDKQIKQNIENTKKQLEQDCTHANTWFSLGNLYEYEQSWLQAVEAYRHAIARQNKQTTECYYRLGYALTQIQQHQQACEVFKGIDLLKSFRNRIKKELKHEVVSFIFDEGCYKLSFLIINNSSVNPDIRIKDCLIKHRVRIGNELDSFYLMNRKSTQLKREGFYEFELNPKDYDFKMHYWDLFIEIEVVDKVYGNVLVELTCSHFSQNILETVDSNPWILAVKDDKTIFHPYLTAGGRKIAFLKRPLSQYDDPIYTERENKALKEYQENKQELDSQKAWLIYEKFSRTAQDNAFYFFKYAVNQRPHVYYVIEKDSPDKNFLEGYEENFIEFMSIEHMKLLLSCEMIISSEGRGHGYAWRRISGEFKRALLNKRYVFLQHGVIGLKKLGNDFNKNNINFSASKFVCSSVLEKNIVLREFEYDESDIILSGLPRWEGLKDKSHNYDEVFLMPTWRNWLEDLSDEDFIQTDYFKAYSSLLASEKLNRFLNENSLTLNFYLHAKVIEHLSKFNINKENIRVVDFGEITIRELLQRAKVLITDYSSVAWDFVYLKKPVVFYHFDVEEYKKYQGAYIDLKKDIPGAACYTQDELIDSIAHSVKNVEIGACSLHKLYEDHFAQVKNPSEVIYKDISVIGNL